MGDAPSSETTQLLRDWAGGDQTALDKLTPRVYDELRRIASRRMRGERAGQTLQATALAHEAYLRLIDVTGVEWNHRAQFYAIAAQIMRNILIERARRRMAWKRGGGITPLNLEEAADPGTEQARELIALNDALNELARIDPRKARVVELRFFGGLSVEESAKVLEVSPETVMRDWKFARAWLESELSS